MELLNQLKERRQLLGLSQKQLGNTAGITRQAVAAIETNRYSPATSVALQLARALRCRVEDLFSIKRGQEIIEGKLLELIPEGNTPMRAQVTQIGDRILVRPLHGRGELANLSATADGLIVESNPDKSSVKVRLLQDLEAVRRKIVVGGCDPAMFLAAEYIGKDGQENLIPCLMGNSLALSALKRGEVHAAGIHLAEEVSDGWELADLKQCIRDMECIVVTFAHWEEGFVVRPGNPKKISSISEIARPTVRIINRESGSGARRLLDKQMRASAIDPKKVRGYSDEVLSHLEVASRIKAGLADVGIAVCSVAWICGLDFVPLQRERYDLLIPKSYYQTLTGLRVLLETIVTKPFREELEALGGYDTRHTGKLIAEIGSHE